MAPRDRLFERLGNFVRSRPFATALITLVVLVVPGYARVEFIASDARAAADTANHAVEAVDREAVAGRLAICEAQRDSIIVLRQVVELTASSGEPLSFTSVPGFAELTPELRSYLTNLEALLAGNPDDPGFADQALALLTEPDC